MGLNGVANKLLVDVTNAVISSSNRLSLLRAISPVINELLKVNFIGFVEVKNPSGKYDTDIFRCESEELVYSTTHYISGFEKPCGDKFCIPTNIKDVRFDGSILEKQSIPEDVEKVCIYPLLFRREKIGYVVFMWGEEQVDLNGEKLELLEHISARLSISMHSFMRNPVRYNLPRNTDLIPIEMDYSKYKISDKIIGQNKNMYSVITRAMMVSDCNSTVLITGETGTGKELVAEAIHEFSSRRDKKLVKVNCSAIPETLFESEIFGHEKGAFTGASNSRKGRFEEANHGTLLLDEVGILPLNQQPKLLRVLQESEVEKLGGSSSVSIDVRVVAATNADLSQMVNEKEFRSDLFYRLNIFPINIPPLRERKDDIPILVNYFTYQLSRIFGKEVKYICKNAMNAMLAYDWPGNVRQLRNFIERALVLTTDKVLTLPNEQLLEISPTPSEIVVHEDVVNEDPRPCKRTVYNKINVDRDVVVQALKESNGVVAGKRGAAAKLGIKRTTLLSRMQKMGIDSKDYL